MKIVVCNSLQLSGSWSFHFARKQDSNRYRDRYWNWLVKIELYNTTKQCCTISGPCIGFDPVPFSLNKTSGQIIIWAKSKCLQNNSSGFSWCRSAWTNWLQPKQQNAQLSCQFSCLSNKSILIKKTLLICDIWIAINKQIFPNWGILRQVSTYPVYKGIRGH